MINLHQVNSWFLLALMLFNPFPAGIKSSSQPPAAAASAFNPNSFNLAPDQAQSPAESSTHSIVVPLSQTGFSGKTFSGIYDNVEVLFKVPADWNIIFGSHVTIKYSVRMLPDEAQRFFNTGQYPTLYVHYNYWQIATITINKPGDFQLDIPITQSMAVGLKNGSSVLGFTYDNGVGCINNNGVSVSLDPESTLNLSYATKQVEPALSTLPGPFFPPGNIGIQNITTLIVPDRPSISELQAALSTAASLGSLAKGQGELNLVKLGNLTDDARKNNNLILVGKSFSLPILNKMVLPAAMRSTGFAPTALIGRDDGVVQLAISPWNISRALLLVSGDTDGAVIKAGQSVRTNISTVPGYQGLALVKNYPQEIINFTPENTASGKKEDWQFKDLGFSDSVLAGVGNQSADYYFTVQPGQDIGKDAYLNLNVSPSDGLNLSKTLMVVRINDNPIFDATMTQQFQSKQVRTFHIPIPNSEIYPGRNSISVELSLAPKNICDNGIDPLGAWKNAGLWSATIQSDSLLHLPGGTGAASPSVYADHIKTNLALYPGLLLNRPSLENLAFILSPDDPASWDTAVKLAFDLGGKSNFSNVERGPVLLHALYNNALGDTAMLSQKNVVVVGKNDGLGDLKQANSVLINEYNSPVIYRVLPDTSLGYIDLLPSTWDKAYSMLLVRGNNDIGVALAGDILTQAKYKTHLAGSSLTTNGTQIIFAKP